MFQARIEREDFIVLLIALAFIVPILVIYALFVIPEELWPLKILIVLLLLLIPAGYIKGHKNWRFAPLNTRG